VTDFNEAKSTENRNFSSGFIKTIGYNGDYLMRSYNFILNSFTFKDASGFYSYYIEKAFLINPMGLIKKIYLEMIYFYDESNVFSEQGSNLATWKNSLDTVQSWKPIFLKNHKVYDSYVERLNIVKDYAYDYNVPSNNYLKRVSVALNNIYIFICILFLFSLFICYKTYKSILPFGIFTLFIFLIINSIILNISVGATTVIGRYIYDIYSLNLLFILSSVFFIMLILKSIITHLIQKKWGAN
jgi:hypothetical protein